MSQPDHDSKTSSSRRDPIKAYAVLLQELQTLQYDLGVMEIDFAESLQQVDSSHLTGATNLVHYLGLRQRDIRPLQKKLSAVGLSSLGRAESHVLASLQAIIALLQHALELHQLILPASSHFADVALGPALLKTNTNNLLGSPPAHRRARIMVTLPGETADDYALIRDMLLQGMDCARINGAHDNPKSGCG